MHCFYTKVVSSESFHAFYVVFFPLEYITTIPPHSTYVTNSSYSTHKQHYIVLTVDVYGLTCPWLREGGAYTFSCIHWDKTCNSFTCMFDDNLWKSYVCRTIFSYVKYQDLCATINTSKIKYLQESKNNL